jgi:hypothetical protein
MIEKGCAYDQLSLAKFDVAEARRVVDRQRRLIEELQASGLDTEDAERSLTAFLLSLSTLEGHLRSLSKPVQ